MDRGHFESIEKPCLGIGDFRKVPDEKVTDPQTSLVPTIVALTTIVSIKNFFLMIKNEIQVIINVI